MFKNKNTNITASPGQNAGAAIDAAIADGTFPSGSQLGPYEKSGPGRWHPRPANAVGTVKVRHGESFYVVKS